MCKTERFRYKNIDWHEVYAAFRSSGLSYRKFHAAILPRLVSAAEPDAQSVPALSNFISHMLKIREHGAADSGKLIDEGLKQEIYRQWQADGKRKIDFIKEFIRQIGNALSRTTLYKLFKREDNKTDLPDANDTVRIVNLDLPAAKPNAAVNPAGGRGRNKDINININFPSGIGLSFQSVDPEFSAALIIKHLSQMLASRG